MRMSQTSQARNAEAQVTEASHETYWWQFRRRGRRCEQAIAELDARAGDRAVSKTVMPRSSHREQVFSERACGLRHGFLRMTQAILSSVDSSDVGDHVWIDAGN